MPFPPVPFDKKKVDKIISESGLSIGTASIREVNRIINIIEKELGVTFIHMEFGIPGLEVAPIAIDAEIDALKNKKVANTYSPFDGVPILKETAKEFVKAFMNIDVPTDCCIPTCGNMHGGFISIGLSARRFKDQNKILFLDPGFPVNKLQCKVLGIQSESLDFYDYRGNRLLEGIEKKFAIGSLGGIMYSNPNNPTWVCLKESELEGIGKLCSNFNVIAIEDLAYFGMDFREEYGIPYQPPYQPSVANYTDNYILLISSSKIFSYAGQRVGVAIISPKLFQQRTENLKQFYGTDTVGHAFVHGGMYPTTAGVSASPQYGLAALFRAAVNGDYVFTSAIREYQKRTKEIKKAFLENGFSIVYDNDLGEPLADGFYFSIAYPGFDGPDLILELIYYGISAITLLLAGSVRDEGLRICVSLTQIEQIPELRYRLEVFHKDHKQN